MHFRRNSAHFYALKARPGNLARGLLGHAHVLRFCRRCRENRPIALPPKQALSSTRRPHRPCGAENGSPPQTREYGGAPLAGGCLSTRDREDAEPTSGILCAMP